MSSRFCIAVLAIFISISASFAADDTPDLAVRYPYYRVGYTINPDGSFVETRSWAATVLKEQALASLKRSSVSFSTSIQRTEVVEAFTLKADGRRVDAPKSNYQIEENRGKNKDAPVFSDFTTLTVVFPDVEVGDTVAFSYRMTAIQPMFPGQFSTSEAFYEYNAYDDVRVSFDYPASLPVRYQARRMTEIANTEEKGRKRVEWNYRNPQPAKNKRTDYSVYELEKNPGVAFSTFRNYAEIAEAYGTRARPKSQPTERVRKLADEIASAQAPQRETARRLYDWVATHITYAGNCIGLGAVVPHDTDFILDNRMGDCKDHATLLQALLAAKGIESTQALVNAGSSYKLPEIPVVSMVNHVINYLPGLDLYVDSTSNSTPFGLLPFSDNDKPVLWVDGYRDGTRTPPVAPGINQQIMKTVVKIRPDGSVSGHVDVQLKGAFAASSRESFRNISKDYEAEMVKEVFRSMGFIGGGVLTREDPQALLDTFQYSAAFEIEDWVVVPGPGAFPIQPLFFSESPVSRYVGAAVQDIEGVEQSTCFSGKSIEEYVYEFPANMKVLAAPDDFKFDSDMLSYSAAYVLKHNTLTVRRVFDDRTPGNVCSAAQLAEFKQFAQRVKPNFRGQVVYK